MYNLARYQCANAVKTVCTSVCQCVCQSVKIVCVHRKWSSPKRRFDHWCVVFRQWCVRALGSLWQLFCQFKNIKIAINTRISYYYYKTIVDVCIEFGFMLSTDVRYACRRVRSLVSAFLFHSPRVICILEHLIQLYLSERESKGKRVERCTHFVLCIFQMCFFLVHIRINMSNWIKTLVNQFFSVLFHFKNICSFLTMDSGISRLNAFVISKYFSNINEISP